MKGAPAPLIEGVQRGVRGSGGQGGSANYDVSANGTLVYVPGFIGATGVPRRLLSVDPSGNSVPLIDDERDFWRPRISPDGTRVAVEVVSPNSVSQVWSVDLEQRTLNPVGDERETGYPVWTPDGKSVIYRRGEGSLYRQPADGSEGAQLLVNSPGSTFRVMDVSRDGVVAVATGSPQDDIQTFHLGTGAMSEFLATPAREYMRASRPTAAGWRTRRTSLGATKSTSGRSHELRASRGSCRSAADPGRSGRRTGPLCTTEALLVRSWPCL